MSLLLLFSLGTGFTYGQKDFLQFDVGSTVYFDNRINYDIPGVVHFKTRASETYIVGINYQRKISDIIFVSAGTYFTTTSFAYSVKYNWQMTDTKKEWQKNRHNDGSFPSIPTLKIPISVGIEFPVSANKKHLLTVSSGLSFTFLQSSSSGTSWSFITENTENHTYYNDINAIRTHRDASNSFQLFANIRGAYYFKIPKLGFWNVFFVYEPQITKNTVGTEIILMEGTPHETYQKLYLNNHNIQMGIGYRFGLAKPVR